ncbi:hypothetical protein AB0C33_44565 [Nonomuraea sp. NPDC048881]
MVLDIFASDMLPAHEEAQLSGCMMSCGFTGCGRTVVEGLVMFDVY